MMPTVVDTFLLHWESRRRSTLRVSYQQVWVSTGHHLANPARTLSRLSFSSIRLRQVDAELGWALASAVVRAMPRWMLKHATLASSSPVHVNATSRSICHHSSDHQAITASGMLMLSSKVRTRAAPVTQIKSFRQDSLRRSAVRRTSGTAMTLGTVTVVLRRE